MTSGSEQVRLGSQFRNHTCGEVLPSEDNAAGRDPARHQLGVRAGQKPGLRPAQGRANSPKRGLKTRRRKSQSRNQR